MQKNKIDREAHARKRKETTDSNIIEGHKKRITAGLVLASAQTFALGPNILAATLEWKRILDIVISEKKHGNMNSIHFVEKNLN